MNGLKFLLLLNHDYALSEGTGDTITVGDKTFTAESPEDILKAKNYLNESTGIKAELTSQGLLVSSSEPFYVSETLTSASSYWVEQ